MLLVTEQVGDINKKPPESNNKNSNTPENWPAEVDNIEVIEEDIEVREEEEDIENKESQNLSCSKASDWTLNSSRGRWRFVTFVAVA